MVIWWVNILGSICNGYIFTCMFSLREIYFDGVIWLPYARPRPESVRERKKGWKGDTRTSHCE